LTEDLTSEPLKLNEKEREKELDKSEVKVKEVEDFQCQE
jgi:hypothetical protein